PSPGVLGAADLVYVEPTARSEQMVSRHAPHEPRSYRPGPQTRQAAPRLTSFDLTLLLVFDALYAERSVTRAGHRLGLSQSAMSHALGRLRDQLGDDLFTKGGDGMVPTARERAIASRIHARLSQMQTALSDTQF